MIIHYPEQSWIIKIGFLIHLYFTRSHNYIRKSYEDLYAAHVRVKKKPKFHYASIIWRRIIRGKKDHEDWSRYDNLRGKRSCSYYEGEEKSYARTGLADQFPFWKFWDTLTNITFVYVVLRTLIPTKLISYLLPDRSFKKNCILPGYFVVFNPLQEQFAFSLSIFHLVWRIYQWKTQPKFRLDFLMFMIQNDNEFERVLSSTGREYSKVIESDCFYDQEDDEYKNLSEEEEEELEVARIIKEEKLKSHENSTLTNYDDFLKYIMYFPIKYDTKIVYKLRPNRSKEARAILVKQTIKFYKLSYLYFTILFWVIFPIALYVVLSDLCWLENYPGCWPFLEELHKKEKLHYLSIHVSGPKMYTSVFDAIMNACIWIDSGAAVVFVIPIAYILNYDILLYWKHLQSKLEDVLYQLKVDWLITSNQIDAHLRENYNVDYNINCFCDDNGEVGNNEKPKINHEHYHMRDRTITISSCYDERRKSTITATTTTISTANLLQTNDNLSYHNQIKRSDKNELASLFRNTVKFYSKSPDNLSRKLKSIENRAASRAIELENIIYVLQAELTDFFKQIEHVDLIVSDILSAAYLIWFSTFALITYSTLTKSLVGNMMGLRMIQGIGFSAISVTSIMLLTLNHHTNRSYETICSIMAYDKSKFKKQFLKIIEFYTRRNCSSYTLFHSYPYLATTYLTAIAWNFSCATILENLSMRT